MTSGVESAEEELWYNYKSKAAPRAWCTGRLYFLPTCEANNSVSQEERSKERCVKLREFLPEHKDRKIAQNCMNPRGDKYRKEGLVSYSLP